MAEPSNPAAAGKDPEGALAGGLYIVATPIGNLGDMTDRARKVLAAADLIACEDTRITARLLERFGIRGRLLAYHEHNAARMRPRIMEALERGAVVALVSDAGTPLISDPGYRLVGEARRRGFPVIPVPGASSVMAALMVAGLPTDRFYFAGFPPVKERQRNAFLQEIAGVPGTLVLLESPRRVEACLRAIAATMPGREVVIARELTKMYEEVITGMPEDILARFADEGTPRGEMVLMIAPPGKAEAADEDVDILLAEALKQAPPGRAASEVARATGRRKADIYRRAMALRAQEGIDGNEGQD